MTSDVRAKNSLTAAQSGGIAKAGRRWVTGTREITVSEALGLHELLLVDATMIDKLGVYAEEAENRELESMFRSHLRKFEQNYNELVSFAGGETAFSGTGHGSFTGAGVQPGGQKSSHQVVRPQPMGRLQDRTMLMDCLINCKELAVASVKVATECSSTALRRTLADVSRHHLEMAYDLYKIAEQHGWYPELKAQENPGQWLRSTHLPIQGTTMTNGWRGYEQTAYNTAQPYATGEHRTPMHESREMAASAGGFGETSAYGNTVRHHGEITNGSQSYGTPGWNGDGGREHGDRSSNFRTQ